MLSPYPSLFRREFALFRCKVQLVPLPLAGAEFPSLARNSDSVPCLKNKHTLLSWVTHGLQACARREFQVRTSYKLVENEWHKLQTCARGRATATTNLRQRKAYSDTRVLCVFPASPFQKLCVFAS